jgi:hypothetical protein
MNYETSNYYVWSAYMNFLNIHVYVFFIVIIFFFFLYILILLRKRVRPKIPQFNHTKKNNFFYTYHYERLM